MTVRIASWNTWKNDGAYRQRLPAMVKVLSELKPDVVLLQECFQAKMGSSEFDTAAHLSEALDLQLCFAPARQKVRYFESEPIPSLSGHAILSTGHLEAIERRELITTEAGGERIALFSRAMVGEKSIALACIHFAHRRDEGAIRSQQLASVVEHLAQYRQAGELSLIGGDFNMTVESPDFRNAKIPNGVFILDVHRELGQDGPTATVPFKEGHRGRRIDLLLGLTDLGEEPPRGHAAGVSGWDFDLEYDTYPSDHALVWADLEL